MNEEKWKEVDEKIKAKLTILSENSRAKVCSTNCLVDETMMVISEIYHSEIEQAEKEAVINLAKINNALVEANKQAKIEGARELAEKIIENMADIQVDDCNLKVVSVGGINQALLEFEEEKK